jgi:hypothetical protein
MAADGALQETLVAKRIEAALFSVPLPRGKQKRQIAWFTSVEETLFQRDHGREDHHCGHRPADRNDGATRQALLIDIQQIVCRDPEASNEVFTARLIPLVLSA